MKTEVDRLWPALFHGWVELLTLFLVLFLILTLWGWARNRGYRPVERASTTPWLLVLIAFALVLILRNVRDDLPQAGAILVGMIVAGWMGRTVPERQLWIPGMLLATLVGMGFMLSALVLAGVGFIVFLLSARRS